MAVTTLSNIINPQVMGDMINAKTTARLKLTPYAKVDTTLQGVAGDTKTVPKWAYVGDAVDVAEGGEVDVDNLTASSTTFTIKKAQKSIGIYQEAINSGLGDPLGQAETQLAKSIAGKLDSDVLDACYASGNVYAGDTLGTIAYAGIVDANAKFEDEEDGIEKVMFIHPNQEATVLKDADFISADKYEAGVMVRGSIGKVAGCWVKKSKKVKLIGHEKDASGTITIVSNEATESATAKHLSSIQPTCASILEVGDKVNVLAEAKQYYLNPIIKMEPDSEETEYTENELPAVTIFLKKDISIDPEWFPKKQRHDVTATKYYGVALTNDAKVVLTKFKK